MSLTRGAIVTIAVAVLVSGTAAVVGCSCGDAATSSGGPGTETSEAAGTAQTDDASASSGGDGTSDGTAGTASSAGSLDEEDLSALAAELEAMESELGSLDLPDNDFGDIEALLD